MGMGIFYSLCCGDVARCVVCVLLNLENRQSNSFSMAGSVYALSVATQEYKVEAQDYAVYHYRKIHVVEVYSMHILCHKEFSYNSFSFSFSITYLVCSTSSIRRTLSGRDTPDT